MRANWGELPDNVIVYVLIPCHHYFAANSLLVLNLNSMSLSLPATATLLDCCQDLRNIDVLSLSLLNE